MIPALIVLGISFLAMAAMLTAKHFEIKAGRHILAARARTWVEHHAHVSLSTARSAARTATTKHFWTGVMAFISQKFVKKVWHQKHVQTVTKKASDVVRGKREIKSKGPASFYLKDVTDYKNQVRSQ